MKFVDVHIHLSDPQYERKVEEILDDAKRSNVVALVSNSMNLRTSLLSLQLAEENSGFVFAALGIHPWNVGTHTRGGPDSSELRELFWGDAGLNRQVSYRYKGNQ